jgi:sulfur-oxidizing protein SoxY
MMRLLPARSGRRALLATLAAVAALGPGGAGATPEAARTLLDRLATAAPRAGRIVLRADAVIDDGNHVPLTVTVDSPMTEADHVRALHLVADGNPNPGIASFGFTPRVGRCEVSLRMRLARSQRLYALAEMSDGSTWTVSREVVVTTGGCAAS